MVIKRNSYDGMDTLRAISCYLVILSHIVIFVFPEINPVWEATVFYKSFIRVAVPAFLMISGFLLLDKKENIGVFYKKRAKRVLMPFVFYMVFYYILTIPYRGQTYSLSGFVKFWAEGGTVQMWYLFNLIGIYSFMPFMRIIYQNSTQKEQRIFIGFWVVVTVLIPFVVTLGEIDYNFTSNFAMYQFFGNIGYVFIGAYMKEVIVSRRFVLLCGFFISIFFTMLFTYAYSYYLGHPSGVFLSRTAPLIVIATVCFFLTFKDIKLNKYKKIITAVSKNSFGIYLIHIAVIRGLQVVKIDAASHYPWISQPILSLLVLIISFYLIKFGKMVPYLRNVVG